MKLTIKAVLLCIDSFDSVETELKLVVTLVPFIVIMPLRHNVTPLAVIPPSAVLGGGDGTRGGLSVATSFSLRAVIKPCHVGNLGVESCNFGLKTNCKKLYEVVSKRLRSGRFQARD